MNEVNKMQMIAKVSDGFISHYNISVKTEKKKMLLQTCYAGNPGIWKLFL